MAKGLNRKPRLDSAMYSALYSRFLYFILVQLLHSFNRAQFFYCIALHSLYRSPNVVRMIKSRRLRWAGHVARMEESRDAFKILTGKPTGKRRRWEDNVGMDLEEIGINAGNWVDSAQDRDYWRALLSAALDLRVP